MHFYKWSHTQALHTAGCQQSAGPDLTGYKHLFCVSASSLHLGCSIHAPLSTLVRNPSRRSHPHSQGAVAAPAVSPPTGGIWQGRCSVMFRWMLQCQWSTFWEYQFLFKLMIPRSSLSHKFLCFFHASFQTHFLKCLLLIFGYCITQLIVILSQTPLLIYF